jgi:CheY-like chemotaxis protein
LKDGFGANQDEPANHARERVLLQRLTNEIADLVMMLQPSLVALDELAQNEPLLVEHAKIVGNATSRMSGYVRDINVLAATFSPPHSTAILPVLEEFIDEQLDRLPANVRFISRLLQDLWTVRLVVSDVKDLCRHLLNNAIAATQHGGEVRLEADNVVLHGANAFDLPNGDYVRVRVTDDGSGMSEAVRIRASEPFYTTWGREGHWRGLGLAQVDAICRRGRGGFLLQSSERHGTVATALLRRALLTDTPIAKPHKEGPRLATLNFLVVDDEPLILALLRRGLTECGHCVHVAQDAHTAHTVLAEGLACDIALVDHHLGQDSGLDLVRELRSRYPNLRTVLMTGFGSQCSIPSGGGIVVLQKPFEIAELLAILAADVSCRKER